jgi:drug/metabolite transporter (DMT)-like permease
MKHDTLKSAMVLLLAALIWGMGFVAQRYGMDLVGPFFFSGMRTLLAALTILLVIAVTRAAAKHAAAKRERRTEGGTDEPSPCPAAAKREGRTEGRTDEPSPCPAKREGGTDEPSPCPAAGEASPFVGATRDMTGARLGVDRFLLKGGVLCGVVLFLGQALQQVGMVYTTASKAGFLTALYIVLVPIISIFLKKHTHWNTWVSVAVAALGLYFLSITAAFTILPGDLVLLIGAALWATHILVTAHYVPSLDQQAIYRLVTIQFITCAVLSFALAPFIDMKLVPIPLTPDILAQALPALLYAGCISAGVGFTLQAIGQRRINPSAAGIILSLEAVFGAIGGAALLSERLSARETLGCALMFTAVILSQIPVKEKRGAEL